MKTIEPLKSTNLSDESAINPIPSGCTLSIAGVYQDSVTREWAMQYCRRGTRIVGEECVQTTWHDANSLGDPPIFHEAVSAAAAADVIVVSLHAAEDLPIQLYAWIESWLPRRFLRMGALAALIGVGEPSDTQVVRTLSYLQAVARKGNLDFIPQERQRLMTATTPSMKRIPRVAIAAPESIQEIYAQRFDVYGDLNLAEQRSPVLRA
jgi:hypothetical protein